MGIPNVVLVGMPGSGKSAVGRQVAAWLGWPFLDTDDIVARRAGRPIPEIFAHDGEAAFRRIEREAVREAARKRPAVIATGGGVVTDPRNMDALRDGGMIVGLVADADVLLERLGADGGDRPLLVPDPPARLEALLAERAPRYAEADLVLDATRPADQLAQAIITVVAEDAEDVVTVDLGPRSYPVSVGAGTLDLLGWEVRRRLPSARAVVLTHSRLWRRFGRRVERGLGDGGAAPLVITVPEGEQAKSLRRASAVIDRMAAEGIDRGAVVVALGGGVIGDLAGFVAGTYMRGVSLVHAPTTLLAQVDSAIGGKAAVNHPRAKNLVGVFHQPVLVLADVETLRTLPPREIRSGFAEVVKYGMVADADLLGFVEEHLDALLRLEPESLRRCVRWCVGLKARVVHEDERDAGPRQVLNYGHTVGHALEIVAGGAFTHGEAVAVGMTAEGRIAQHLGLAAPELVRRQEALLARVGLPTVLPADGPAVEELLAAMRLDKKLLNGEARFTLLRGPGEGLIDQTLPESLLKEMLLRCRASS